MTRPIPKQHFKHPHSIDHGEYDAYHEICDVEPIKAELRTIGDHVREAWFEDEVEPALLALCEASLWLTRFKALADAHRERVLD